jgi:hypothetical protein
MQNGTVSFDQAFNSAGGSVMQAYGNLFQEQENISYSAVFDKGVVIAAVDGSRTDVCTT